MDPFLCVCGNRHLAFSEMPEPSSNLSVWIWGDGRHMSYQFYSFVIFQMYLIIHGAYIMKTNLSLVCFGRACGWRQERGMTEKDHEEGGREGWRKADNQWCYSNWGQKFWRHHFRDEWLRAGSLPAPLEKWRSGLVIQTFVPESGLQVPFCLCVMLTRLSKRL